MTVDHEIVGPRTSLAVAGEIDLASAPDLRAAIDGALDGGAAELWLDLTATTFMDSSGLHLLLEARNRAQKLDRRLVIVCPRGAVQRAVELVGLEDALPLYEDLAAAHLAALHR